MTEPKPTVDFETFLSLDIRALAVVNFEPRRIAGFRSEVLVLGDVDPEDPGDVVLVRPDFGQAEAEKDVRGWPLG